MAIPNAFDTLFPTNVFRPLVDIITRLSTEGDKGDHGVKRSQAGSDLIKSYPKLYTEHGFKNFKEYTMAAAQQDVVVLGGAGGDAWIELSEATRRQLTVYV